MSIEDELLQLARDRDAATQSALDALLLDAPDFVRRQLRTYLFRQVDHGRIRRPGEQVPQLATLQGGVSELNCPQVEFSSGSSLEFSIRLRQEQRGWIIAEFRFQLRLAQPRRIRMVRIHLNPDTRYDPLSIPRCHMHVDDSGAHIPFPIMDPRLILFLMCEHLEPDFGA